MHIALGQVRKLFNAIVDEHGKPYEVVVELARDLKQNEQQRRDDQERQKETENATSGYGARLPTPVIQISQVRTWRSCGSG